jgi:hypothetical protein
MSIPAPTYNKGEAIDKINSFTDLEGLVLLGNLLREEKQRYSSQAKIEMAAAYKLKYETLSLLFPQKERPEEVFTLYTVHEYLFD